MDAAALQSAGWSRIHSNEFTGMVGPFWTRIVDGVREVGFPGDDRHANHVRTVSGGMLMTFADLALGYRAVDALGGALNCVTAQLQLQFVATARLGDFVSCRPELIRHSGQLMFLRGLICVGDKTVASADGIWKVLEPRPRE